MKLTLAKQTIASDELAAALSALERGGAITPVSLDLSDTNVSYEAWLGLGDVIGRVRKASSWWIGDWYIFGLHAPNVGEERAVQAEWVTGLRPATLTTIVRTCMFVPKSRRRLALPFSTHTEVAGLMPEEQDRWLRLAEEGDGRRPWTREQLREAMRFRRQAAVTSEPQWQGAVEMRRQLDVERVAREIFERAVPGETHYLVECELMTKLGEALGKEQ